MQEQKLFRCEPDDPGRCQGMGLHGQCGYLSVEACVERGLLPNIPVSESQGVDRCMRHAANSTLEANRKRNLTNYRLGVWEQRVKEFAEDEGITSLRSEIGVLKLILESVLQQAEDVQSLILFSPKLQSLINQITRTTHTCAQLECKMGMILTRTQALKFAQNIVTVLNENISDPEAIDRISNAIITELSQLGGPEDDV